MTGGWKHVRAGRFIVAFDSTTYDGVTNKVRVRHFLPTVSIAWCDRFSGFEIAWWRWGIKVMRLEAGETTLPKMEAAHA